MDIQEILEKLDEAKEEENIAEGKLEIDDPINMKKDQQEESKKEMKEKKKIDESSEEAHISLLKAYNDTEQKNVSHAPTQHGKYLD